MNHLLVIGGGFAGTRAAQAAALLARGEGRPLAITLVSERDRIILRPRLYKADPESWEAPLRPALDPLGIAFVEARAVGVDPARRKVTLEAVDGRASSLSYDALVVATGSRLRSPAVPGLLRHAFNADTAAASARLLDHIGRLDPIANSPGATFAVIGAGFTGLEIATELRAILAQAHGTETAQAARILLVDRAADAEANLGAATRPVIAEALRDARIETRFGRTVASADAGGILLDDGERIPTLTMIFAGGMEAAPLPIAGMVERDDLGRVVTDECLRVPGAPGLFVAGDAARAVTDDEGHIALMSCQHALPMGWQAGRNAGAHLLGLPLAPYRQRTYVTCLDLGIAGAMLASGWEREPALTGDRAKLIKQSINNFIAPPTGSVDEILRAFDASAQAADNMPAILTAIRPPTLDSAAGPRLAA